jgi:hypothetical protein
MVVLRTEFKMYNKIFLEAVEDKERSGKDL